MFRLLPSSKEDMRSPLPFAIASALLLFGHAGCKRTPDVSPSTDGPSASVQPAPRERPRAMPKPLKLPDTPQAVAHLGAPAEVLATLSSWAGPEFAPRDVMASALRQAGRTFELKLVDHVDLSRSWDAATIQGQTIVHVAILPDRVDEVARLLEGRPERGKFGAVELQRAPNEPGPRLAWLDTETSTLTLADDLRGLATGMELERAYGRQPLLLSVSKGEAFRYGVQMPFERVSVRGTGLHDFELSTQGVPDEPIFEQITEGALTGMLENPHIALGLSTRYKNYEQDVRSILGQINRRVAEQNFLVRGTLEDLSRRLGSVLRSWNGRVLAGVGPARHVVLGLGTSDANHANRAVLHLLAGLIDNIQLADALGLGGNIPKLRLRRDTAEHGGVKTHRVDVPGARRFLPPQMHPMIDDEGTLKIAMAFAPRAGGAMVVAGPRANRVLLDWLAAIDGATPAAKSAQHLVAATFAVAPGDVRPLLWQDEPTPNALFQLEASGQPTRIILERKADGLQLRARGPQSPAARRAAQGATVRTSAKGGPVRARPRRVAPSR